MASGVRDKTRTIVWTRAAGCCQYSGCNESLIGDFISGNEDTTFGFIAHIVAREPNGPRGDAVRSPQLVDDPANLMLLCAKHHKLIDVDDPAGHSEARLRAMKDEHERRVRAVVALQEEKATHVLRYGAKVGEHTGPIAFDYVKTAVLPDRYPVASIAIELRGSVADDRGEAYWSSEIENLRQQFDRKVRAPIEDGEIRHLSVFALAPIPLLVELGRLLGDIGFCSVFQLVREPKGWRWPEAGTSVTFQINRPESGSRGVPVALVLSVSATVLPERIHQAIGDQAAIWEISADRPNNDVIRSPDDLVAFRQIAREALAAIRLRHPEAEVIHVFPATPVSVSVELGRVWQPKADLPMLIYDQTAGVGFVPRLRLERR